VRQIYKRVDLYRWAFENLFSKCKPGQIACMEPQWKRSEFADYIVQNNSSFTVSLLLRKVACEPLGKICSCCW
jgi:hypothetical protein